VIAAGVTVINRADVAASDYDLIAERTLDRDRLRCSGGLSGKQGGYRHSIRLLDRDRIVGEPIQVACKLLGRDHGTRAHTHQESELCE
jgi:hypothetical protein